MTYKAKPDYERCVGLVTQAALREMRFPGLICVITPITVGVVFRFVGEATNRALLGAEVLASYLMFGTVTGILMALFLDTAGKVLQWHVFFFQFCLLVFRLFTFFFVFFSFCEKTGGAWDNAKKYIELGNFGGKNSGKMDHLIMC